MSDNLDNNPSLARVKELLHYEPVTGEFRWLVTRSRSAKVGDVAGTLGRTGYIQIQVDRTSYKAHRLAFLFMEGSLPPAVTDHVNGDKLDNRWVNLRHATTAQNNRNRGKTVVNVIGYCGVAFNERWNKFSARIGLEKSQYHLGWYKEKSTAIAVYSFVCKQIHGEFARLDIPHWLTPPDLTAIRLLGGNMRQISKCLAAVAVHRAQEIRKLS